MGVRAVDLLGGEHRVSWPIEGEHELEVGGGVGDACWQRSITGYCKLMTDSEVAEAEKVTVRQDELSIELRLIGLNASDVSARVCRGGSPTYWWGEWNQRATAYGSYFQCSPAAGAGRAPYPPMTTGSS